MQGRIIAKSGRIECSVELRETLSRILSIFLHFFQVSPIHERAWFALQKATLVNLQTESPSAHHSSQKSSESEAGTR